MILVFLKRQFANELLKKVVWQYLKTWLSQFIGFYIFSNFQTFHASWISICFPLLGIFSHVVEFQSMGRLNLFVHKYVWSFARLSYNTNLRLLNISSVISSVILQLLFLNLNNMTIQAFSPSYSTCLNP